MVDSSEPGSSPADEAPRSAAASQRAPESVVRTLLEVTTALTSTLNLDDVLGEMLARTVALAAASAGTIILVDADRRASRLIAVRQGRPYEVSEHDLSKVLSRGLAGWVIEHGSVADVANVTTDERWYHLPDVVYEARSAVCLPLRRHGTTLGAITLSHREASHFDAATVELLAAIAGQAAIAVENAQLFSEVERLAITDPLTGLNNRRRFFDLGHRALASGTVPISAILVDVDHFKTVNDTWGHATGDEVLVEIARRIGALAHDENAVVGRFGGEELALVLPGRDAEGARGVAEALRRAVGDVPIETSRSPLTLTVTISLGVAEVIEPLGSFDDLLQRADRKLYEAKNAGRNCVR